MQKINTSDTTGYISNVAEYTGNFYDRPDSKFQRSYSVTRPGVSFQLDSVLDLRIYRYGSKFRWMAWVTIGEKTKYFQGQSASIDACTRDLAKSAFGYSDGFQRSAHVYIEMVFIPTLIALGVLDSNSCGWQWMGH
jgi:hypothetical protein